MLVLRHYTMDNTNVARAVFSYKSWSLTKADEDCISGFEIEGLRQILTSPGQKGKLMN